MEMSEDLLDYVTRNLVDYPDDVEITSRENNDGSVVLELRVNQRDMGKVIGRGGRTAKSLRALVKMAGTREGIDASVEIVE